MAKGKSSDAPVLRTPDTVQIKVAEHPFLFRGSRNKEVNALIVEAVNRMGGVGDDAEERYRRALALSRVGPMKPLKSLRLNTRPFPRNDTWTGGRWSSSSPTFATPKPSRS
jgi:hypothetical protein